MYIADKGTAMLKTNDSDTWEIVTPSTQGSDWELASHYHCLGVNVGSMFKNN